MTRRAQPHPVVRRAATGELAAETVAKIRALMTDAFGDDPAERFGDDDWAHALGGIHVLVEDGRHVLAHASVVEREIHVAGVPFRTGYVEAVATRPDRQGQGLGSLVMTEVGDLIRERFELGMLGTGAHHFYERLGWRTWQGASFVRTRDGLVRTPDEDGFLLVLETPRSGSLDVRAPISCEWRPGDVW